MPPLLQEEESIPMSTTRHFHVPARLLLLLVVVLLHTVVLAAVQPALQDYTARVPLMQAQIPAITTSAQQAAETMMAHPEALLDVPYWEQMSVAEELMNRAGGLAHAYPTLYWGRTPTKYDVVLLTVRSWEAESALIQRRVKEYKAQGWTVTIIGSRAGMPKALGADYFIENGAPNGKASCGRINVLANSTLAWMWCCEYAAAMSRKGKFPGILYAMSMPGATEHNNKLQSSEGRHTIVDCPTAIPAGELATVYLQRIRTLIEDLNSPHIQGQLAQAADVVATRLASGHTVGIAGMGHGIMYEVMVDNKSPWLGFRAVFVAPTAFRLHLQPGDLLVWMSYNGLNSAIDDYAKYIQAMKLDLVTSYTLDGNDPKDNLPELAHIDQSWKLPDAEVPIPVFPKAMAPVSGINVVLIARMLDDEVSARLAGMKNVHLAARAPIAPELCNLAENYYREESVYTAPVSERKWGYVDARGKQIVAMSYDRAGAFNNGLAVVGKGGKFGVIDRAGKVIVPLQYDAIDIPWGKNPPSFFIVRAGAAWGTIDTAGKVLIAPKYDAIYTFNDTHIVGKLAGQAHLLTLAGEDVPGVVYNDIWSSGEGFAWVNKDGKWGLIDETGKVLIPAQYDDLNNIVDGVAAVQTDGKWGLLNSAGAQVLAPKYDRIGWIPDSKLVQVRLGKKFGMIDLTGKEVVPVQYDEMKDTVDGMTPVKLDGKWGFLDKAGALAIPATYDDAGGFTDGVALVTSTGKPVLIDATGKAVARPAYDYVADGGEGYYKVARNGKWGFIDKTGKEIVPLRYSFVIGFSNGKALVAGGGKWSESVGKCALLVGAKWGVIDKTGKEIIHPKYDRITPSNDGPLAVGRNLEMLFGQP